MDLDKHIDSVKNGIAQAAALADEHSQQVAQRLGQAAESSVRLALIDSLSEAASEISADLAPGSVEFRLTDGHPTFVVTAPPAELPPTELPASQPTAVEPDVDQEDTTPIFADDTDEDQVRVTLRLPASVKRAVDEQAGKEGQSTNTWLMQLITRELRRRGSRRSLDDFINDTVENAMSGFERGWIPGPGSFQPPAPPPPPMGPQGRVGRQFQGWVE